MYFCKCAAKGFLGNYQTMLAIKEENEESFFFARSVMHMQIVAYSCWRRQRRAACVEIIARDSTGDFDAGKQSSLARSDGLRMDDRLPTAIVCSIDFCSVRKEQAK